MPTRLTSSVMQNNSLQLEKNLQTKREIALHCNVKQQWYVGKSGKARSVDQCLNAAYSYNQLILTRTDEWLQNIDTVLSAITVVISLPLRCVSHLVHRKVVDGL